MDLIERQAAERRIDEALSNVFVKTSDSIGKQILDRIPSAQPTLCGYEIDHLILIANVLRKENLPPERVVEALTDIGRIVSMVRDEVRDEFEETLRKAVEQCKI